MNGYLWRICYVNPNSRMLIDRSGRLTLGTTDPVSRIVYLSDHLYGDQLVKVLIHELGHCALISFGLVNEIHKMTKRDYWIYAEEWVCNIIANYGMLIFSIAKDILGYDAWMCIPYELEKIIS